MPLAEIQSALARLYTEPELRRRFFREPDAIGAALGLSLQEAQQLAALREARFQYFSESLGNKRLGEVKKLLPRTAGFMGREFADQFDVYARRPVPSGTQKHREDAAGFARFLARRGTSHAIEPEWLTDLARWESAWIEAGDCRRKWMIRAFRYDIQELLGSSEMTGPVVRRRFTFVIWFRQGERTWRLSMPSWRK